MDGGVWKKEPYKNYLSLKYVSLELLAILEIITCPLFSINLLFSRRDNFVYQRIFLC